MVIPVHGFCGVFADEVMRQVAVHAGGGRVMARLLPALVLRQHDVAIRAGGRIVAQVRKPFRIEQRENTEACQHAEQHGK
jgi:hypothetical protein